jgi:hypothetical protein
MRAALDAKSRLAKPSRGGIGWCWGGCFMKIGEKDDMAQTI